MKERAQRKMFALIKAGNDLAILTPVLKDIDPAASRVTENINEIQMSNGMPLNF